MKQTNWITCHRMFISLIDGEEMQILLLNFGVELIRRNTNLFVYKIVSTVLANENGRLL